MSFLLRFCLGLVVLVPSLAHAQPTSSLDIPGHGTTLSGIGVISGWKCQADGEITVEFLNDAGERMVINEGRTSNPVPMLYGSERPDVRANGACLDNDHDNVGFVAIWNWGELGDGTYTAIAYDNGVPFDENTFTVATPGADFLEGASKQITVDDFPNPGDTMVLEWNQSTQHFEIVDFMGSGLFECMADLTVDRGEMCSGSLVVFGYGVDFSFAVNADGQGCVEVDVPPDFPVTIPEIPCFNTGQELEDILGPFGVSDDVDVTKNPDGSWTINSFPSDL